MLIISVILFSNELPGCEIIELNNLQEQQNRACNLKILNLGP